MAKPKALQALRRAQQALRNGNRAGAMQELARAIQKDPRSVGPYRALAGLLAEIGEVGRAEALLSKAIELDPTSGESLRMRGVLLRRRGRHDASVEPLREAAKRLPRDPAVWRELGEALLLCGDLDPALRAFETLDRLRPKEAAGAVGRAAVLERRGDLDEAVEAVAPWIDQDSFAICIWARACRRLGRSAEATPKVAARLERAKSPQEIERLAHVLGELFVDLGEFAAGFGAHRLGNEARPTAYDPAAHAHRVDSLIRAFPPERFAASPGWSGPATAVLVVGMPRSGTSLAETILSRHSKVHAAGELQALGDIASALPESLQASAHAEQWTEAGRRYLEVARANAGDAACVTDKLPDNTLWLGHAALMVPGVRVVWCRRDPIDTCVSNFFQDFGARLPFSKRLDHLGSRFRDQERLMRHWQATLPVPVHELQYEKLVANPDEQIRALLGFCGLAFEPECLSPHEAKRELATASYAQVQAPLHSRSVGRGTPFVPYLAPLFQALGVEHPEAQSAEEPESTVPSETEGHQGAAVGEHEAIAS